MTSKDTYVFRGVDVADILAQLERLEEVSHPITELTDQEKWQLLYYMTEIESKAGLLLTEFELITQSNVSNKN